MSYVFFKMEEKEMVYLCLAAALSVAAEGLPSRVNPLLAAMMEHSLSFYEKVMGEMGKSSEHATDDSSLSILIR